jgi:predicted phage terminase large subunit-like protein
LLRRQTVRSSLTEWARFIGFEPAPHHRLIIAEIEALLQSSEYDTLLLFAPPGSAKSSYVSIALPGWYLAGHPQASVLAASHSVTLAEKWGRRVRNLIIDHGPTLGIALADDSQAAGRWALKSGGEYLAAGAGVGIAGFRADLGIIDDPFGSRDDAFSEIVRERIWDWFVNDFSARLKPGGKRVIMHTRWHEDDLAGRILEEAKRGRYRTRVLSMPAVAIDRNDPLGRAPGEYLWDDPDGYDYGSFLRARQCELPPAEWAALFQQQPAPEEGDFFRKDWFRWYDEPPKHLQTYGASDYAVTAKGGDYTVHAVVGIDPDDNMYILDVWRKQTESHVWIEANLDLVAQYQPLCWAEEHGQIIKSLGPFIERRAIERNTYCNRQQFLSVRDKPTRCRAFQARCSMGKVYLPRSAPWISDVLAELLSFPAGRHDDVVDALSLIGRLLDEMVGGSVPKVEVKEDPDYRTLEGYNFLGDDFDGEDTWRTV